MQIVDGTATLEVHPFWGHGHGKETVEQAVSLLRALWAANPLITRISIGHDGMAQVEVVIPTDGSLDLYALQKELIATARKATVSFYRSHLLRSSNPAISPVPTDDDALLGIIEEVERDANRGSRVADAIVDGFRGLKIEVTNGITP